MPYSNVDCPCALFILSALLRCVRPAWLLLHELLQPEHEKIALFNNLLKLMLDAKRHPTLPV